VCSPVNTAHPSVKMTVNVNGVDWVVTGGRGSRLTIPFIAGKRVFSEGEMLGRYNRPTVVAYAAPTFADAAINAPRVQQMGLVINGNTHIVPQVNLVMENEADPLMNVNAANDGVESIDIIGRKWRIEIPVIRDGNNDVEWFPLWENGTEFAITSTGFGTAGGNRIQFDCAAVQISEIKHLDHNSRVAYNIVCKILKSSSLANEFSL